MCGGAGAGAGAGQGGAAPPAARPHDGSPRSRPPSRHRPPRCHREDGEDDHTAGVRAVRAVRVRHQGGGEHAED